VDTRDAESELNLVNIAGKSGQHIANKGGISRRLWRNHFFAWSTWPGNLVNKLGYLPNTFCTHNVQNMSKKNLTEADYQHITEIWETSGKHYEHELHILHPIFSISNMLFILCR